MLPDASSGGCCTAHRTRAVARGPTPRPAQADTGLVRRRVFVVFWMTSLQRLVPQLGVKYGTSGISAAVDTRYAQLQPFRGTQPLAMVPAPLHLDNTPESISDQHSSRAKTHSSNISQVYAGFGQREDDQGGSRWTTEKPDNHRLLRRRLPARFPLSKARITFSQLSRAQRETFLLTTIPVGYLLGATDEDVIDIFGRINSVSKTLNSQEKRNAAFSGEFKQFCLSQAASRITLWREYHLFSANDYRQNGGGAIHIRFNPQHTARSI